MTTWRLPTRADTARFGEALGQRLRPGNCVALVGDLGAGKTTLVRAMARGLGVTSHVSSPTFGLIQEYRGPVPMFHIDPYRIQRLEELEDFGFHEFFERGGVVVVEWADMLETMLPSERLTLSIEIDPDALSDDLEEATPRLLRSDATGQEYHRLLADLEADSTLTLERHVSA